MNDSHQAPGDADAANSGNPVALRRIAAQFEFAMLTTVRSDGFLVGRPLQVLQIDAADAVWFFTSAASDKVGDIGCDAHVGLAFSDPQRKIFIDVSGVAEILVDRAKIDELWRPAQLIFFPGGREDASLALLRVTPHAGRYWNGNESVLGLVLKWSRALIRRERSDLGRCVNLDLAGPGAPAASAKVEADTT